MARNRRGMPVGAMAVPEMPGPLDAECVPCLENNGMWYFAAQVRMGERVEVYEVEQAYNPHHYGPQNNSTVLPPIRNAAGTNSVYAMMSEGCPPNTGRFYEKV